MRRALLEHAGLGAWLGIQPEQARALNPAEMATLVRADGVRWNRTVRLTVWAAVLASDLVVAGVGRQINAALGGSRTPVPPLDLEKLAQGAPGFDPGAEE